MLFNKNMEVWDGYQHLLCAAVVLEYISGFVAVVVIHSMLENS